MLVGRRTLIQTAGALALGQSLPAAPAPAEGNSVIASSSVAVTETASGTVRGFVHRGIYVFRGIPYGAPTSGERRFMPPARRAPWKNIRSSLTYGYVLPRYRLPSQKNDQSLRLVNRIRILPVATLK